MRVRGCSCRPCEAAVTRSRLLSVALVLAARGGLARRRARTVIPLAAGLESWTRWGGLQPPPRDPQRPGTRPAGLVGQATAQLERLKWFCWHGSVFRALQTIDDILFDLGITEPGSSAPMPGGFPDYGERHRAGEAISTAFTESAISQVISKRMVKNSRCAGPPRRPRPAPGPHPRPQRPARRRFPPLVPRLRPGPGSHDARSVAPRFVLLPAGCYRVPIDLRGLRRI